MQKETKPGSGPGPESGSRVPREIACGLQARLSALASKVSGRRQDEVSRSGLDAAANFWEWSRANKARESPTTRHCDTTMADIAERRSLNSGHLTYQGHMTVVCPTGEKTCHAT